MSVFEKYLNFGYEDADPRTRDRFLMGSPIPVIAICIFYVILIKVILERFMDKRKAFDTRFVSLALNFYLFLTACYFFFKCFNWFKNYNWRCEPLDRSNSEEAVEIAVTIYAFFLVKLTYMLETVVFMLGKKYSLASKYHVFHHATLPILVWMTANYTPGGHAVFFGLINSITHTIVLGYFVTVTAFPGLKQYTTWWKSAFNWLHIAQFSIIIIHGAQLFIWNFCNFPLILYYAGIAYGVCLFGLYLTSWL